MNDLPEMPVQFKEPLKQYVEDWKKHEESCKKWGADIGKLNEDWKKHQDLTLQIETSLVNQFGKETAEKMLEREIERRRLPRVGESKQN